MSLDARTRAPGHVCFLLAPTLKERKETTRSYYSGRKMERMRTVWAIAHICWLTLYTFLTCK
jgi:hypothetical protein